MRVQYRHVEFNESFEFQGNMYVKYNHNRGKLDPIRTSVHSRPEFRHFKKSDIVIIGDTVTAENAWMEVSCKHKYIPFDNDQMCVECGYSAKENK